MSFNNKLHPQYDLTNWLKWRYCYEGGDAFINKYLMMFSQREDYIEFEARKKMTPSAAFAKSAINDIKNAIYQRAIDIMRAGGSNTYQQSVVGLQGGVDYRNASMNAFIGREVIPELLVLAKVGVYVDNLPQIGPTRATVTGHPYLYVYRAEDILCWSDGSDLTALLLRLNTFDVDDYGLAVGKKVIYRLFQLVNNQVVVTDSNSKGEEISTGLINLPRIPFVIFELTQSLMSDVANYQIGMMNLASSDLNYAIKSNFPFYTEQHDPRVDNINQQRKSEDGSTTPKAHDPSIKVGVAHGRRYPINTERPNFIHPSPDPLRASMEKQENMKADIRQLVNLSLINIMSKSASAESKDRDNEGLEGGLANIGMELERGEREIAEIWAMYEHCEPALIKYPTEYHLESDETRLVNAERKIKIMNKIPSLSFQKEVAKDIVQITLSHRLRPDEITTIKQEINDAVIIDNSSDSLNQDIENGLVSEELASTIRGYPAGQVEQARIDYAQRIARIQAAQTSEGARGVSDLDANPKGAKNEKKVIKANNKLGA